jgi:hypothetical protein
VTLDRRAHASVVLRSRAGTTVSQLRQAYLGRVVRITRSCAGIQSSISLALSPMTCSALPQQGAGQGHRYRAAHPHAAGGRATACDGKIVRFVASRSAGAPAPNSPRRRRAHRCQLRRLPSGQAELDARCVAGGRAPKGGARPYRQRSSRLVAIPRRRQTSATATPGFSVSCSIARFCSSLKRRPFDRSSASCGVKRYLQRAQLAALLNCARALG